MGDTGPVPGNTSPPTIPAHPSGLDDLEEMMMALDEPHTPLPAQNTTRERFELACQEQLEHWNHTARTSSAAQVLAQRAGFRFPTPMDPQDRASRDESACGKLRYVIACFRCPDLYSGRFSF